MSATLVRIQINKMKFLSKDPLNIPFNDWLKENGLYLALGVAAVILIVVGILFLISIRKKK